MTFSFKQISHANYSQPLQELERIPFNTLFARSVLEEKIPGDVFADNCENPGQYYVAHPYGMSLLYGKTDCDFSNLQQLDTFFRNRVTTLDRSEFMQISSSKTEQVMDQLCKLRSKTGRNIEQNMEDPKHYCSFKKYIRINFRFNRLQFEPPRPPADWKNIIIEKLSQQSFNQLKGSVIPSHFWESYESFSASGYGLTASVKNRIIAVAFSSFVHGSQFELGMETLPEKRRRGYGKFLCSYIIQHCLRNKLEPIWACRKDNSGSYRLACSLGFEPVKELPYYEICRHERYH